jgi:hypothetical protein
VLVIVQEEDVRVLVCELLDGIQEEDVWVLVCELLDGSLEEEVWVLEDMWGKHDVSKAEADLIFV